jgi:hypothetical protein
MSDDQRSDKNDALRRIAHVLNTAQVRWEGDTVLAYISAIVTAAIARGERAKLDLTDERNIFQREAQSAERRIIPENWHLVPDLPTPEMVQAGKSRGGVFVGAVYQAMVRAAPSSVASSELRMLVGRNEMNKKIAADPDLPCEAGGSASATQTSEMPAELFDGMAVYVQLGTEKAAAIRPNMVADVLDAVVKLIRKRVRAERTGDVNG